MSVHVYKKWQIFVQFLISGFNSIHEIHENWYTMNNNEFTVYLYLCKLFIIIINALIIIKKVIYLVTVKVSSWCVIKESHS